MGILVKLYKVLYCYLGRFSFAVGKKVSGPQSRMTFALQPSECNRQGILHLILLSAAVSWVKLMRPKKSLSWIADELKFARAQSFNPHMTGCTIGQRAFTAAS